MILISLLTLNQDLFLIIIAVLSSPTLNPMAFSFVLTIYGMNAGGVKKKKKNGEKLSNPNLLLLYLQFLSHVLESLSFCL